MAGWSDRQNPDFAVLLDWLEGRLNDDDAATVAALVQRARGDVRLAARWIEIFLEMSDRTLLADPPPEVRRLLVRRFETLRQPTVRRPRAAVLVWDSRWQPRLAGARAVTLGEPASWHLLYRAEQMDLSFDVVRLDEGTRSVEGQVFPDDPAGDTSFSLLVLQGEVEVATGATDEYGRFVIPPLSAGAYELRLTGDYDVALELDLDADG